MSQTVHNIQTSIALFAEAQTLLPGGVDLPVRAFRAVGGQPLFIEHGERAYLYDVDSNRFVDYVLRRGPGPPTALAEAERIRARPSIEKVARRRRPREWWRQLYHSIRPERPDSLPKNHGW